jgi:hypothetical protein
VQIVEKFTQKTSFSVPNVEESYVSVNDFMGERRMEVFRNPKPFHKERWGRARVRFTVGSFVFSVFFAKVHRVKGICSIVSRNEDVWKSKHIILIDFDTDNYEGIYRELIEIQKDFHLGDIWILRTEHGFHAVAVDVVTFREYIQILVGTEYVDPLFIRMILKRKEATLRYSKKRKSIFPFHKLESQYNPLFRIPLPHRSIRPKSLIHAKIFKVLYGIDFDTEIATIPEIVKKVEYQTVDKDWEGKIIE